MRNISLLAALLLAACSGGSYDYSGFNTYDYLPLDGTRTWKYAQDDLDITWKLQVEKAFSEMKGDTEVVTLDYSQYDPAMLLFSIQWSSDSIGGILIHGYSVEGSAPVTFDPPVHMAEYQMSPGDSIETTTGGATFTSTLQSVESCPNHWVTEDWECLRFTISDGSDGASGAPFVGDWWLAPDWGASRFSITGYSQSWVLSEAFWAPE